MLPCSRLSYQSECSYFCSVTNVEAVPAVVVVTFIRSKATGHTTSTDPSRSHYITLLWNTHIDAAGLFLFSRSHMSTGKRSVPRLHILQLCNDMPARSRVRSRPSPSQSLL